MTKVKNVILIFVGVVIGALGAVGVYFFTEGDVAWQEYIETKLLPNAVLAFTTIGSLGVAAYPIIGKVQAALSNFKQATDDVNATVSSDKAQIERLMKCETQMREFAEAAEALQGDVARLNQMMRIAFCNTDELVRKGCAAEIAKVGEKNE